MADYDSIYEAIKTRDGKAVAAFIQTNADFEEEGGWTPIHEAARAGDLEILQMLIDHGFDVKKNFEISNDSSEYRGSALSEALLHGNVESAKLLIQNGADVNADYFMQNYDSPAAFFGQHDLAEDTGNCLMLAMSYEDDDLLDLMVSNGLNVDGRDREGCTALQCAVSSGKPERVQKLLSLGADVNQHVRDDYLDHLPLLVFAVVEYTEARPPKKERLGVIKTLLRQGPDLSLQPVAGEGETVIDYVLDSKDWELIQIFGLSNVAARLFHGDSPEP